MNPIVLPQPAAEPATPAWDCAEISQCLATGRFRLADGRCAEQAYSCIVTPQPGDRVALLAADAVLYIVHVLARPQPSRALLSVPGAHTLALTQSRLELAATEQLALRSLGDVELSAAQSIALAARHVQACASETLVQDAAHVVTHAQHFVLQVAALLRMHGQQALLTAEHDLKLDAERISLG